MTVAALPPRRASRRRGGRIGLLFLVVALAALVGRSAPARAATEPAKAGETAVAPHAAPHGEGHEDPKLIPNPGVMQVITSLTTLGIFLLLLIVLGKYAWGPIVTGLRNREAKIRKEIQDAEDARARAEATLGEYNAKLAEAEQKVRDLLAKATADAEQIATSIRTRAQAEAEETKEKATRDIEAARNQAVGQIYDEAANLAVSIAEKVLPRTLSAEDRQQLVSRSLDEVRTVSRN